MHNIDKPNTPTAETLQAGLHSDADTSQQALARNNSDSPQLDAHGHDPDDYIWIPVPRPGRKSAARHDGWTPERQRDFIEHLADSGSVTEAAQVAGMTPQSAYRLRRSRKGKQFATAWEAAIGHAMRKLTDVALDRAILGAEDRIITKDGVHIYTKYKPSDRLLMFLLRAHQPHIYGDHHVARPVEDRSGLDISQALERLQPVPPEKLPEYLHHDHSPEDFDSEGYRNDRDEQDIPASQSDGTVNCGS